MVAIKHSLKILCFAVLAATFCLSVGCTEEYCPHLYVEKTVTPPDCSHEGYTTCVCPICSYTYTSDYTAPLGHDFSSETVSPTCTEQGHTVYTCTVCGYSYETDFVPPTGHDCTETVVPPTCTEAGYTLHSCRLCSYTYRDAEVSPSHSYSEEAVPATCSEPGYTLCTCSVCGHSYQKDPTEPHGHHFEEETVRPLIGQTGYTSYTCTDCDFHYIGDYVWYSTVFSGSAGEGEIVARGVDLSYHNGTVDFAALKNAGIDFVILRAGLKLGEPDPKFETYYAAARAAGLDIGVYLYTKALTVEGLRADVKKLFTILGDKSFEYPIYLDMETPEQAELTTEQLGELCAVFCDELLTAGYFPAIYTNKVWMDGKWNVEKITRLYDVWFARYPNAANLETMGLTYYATEYGMWQYTQTGTVAGVTGNVDLNVCYKNYPAIIREYGLNKTKP